MRTRVTIALATVALLVLLPGTALAHASFDIRQLPAGTTQELTLRVPLERTAANDLVEVLVPGAFVVGDCPAADGWDCAQDETAEGDTVLTLARGPDGDGGTERFRVVVTAPTTEGVYAFPTIQTYDDGVEAAWIGEPGSDQPAPRLQVGDATTEVEFSGEATPHTDLAPDGTAAAPTPTAAPTSGPDDAGGADDAASQDETASPGEPARISEPDDASTTDDDGPSAGVIAAGVFLAAVALAGAVARFRSVR
jgi:uncharacterized protein YcnI